MSIFLISPIGRFLVSWYILVPAMVGLGIAAGVLGFVYLTPGKPQIGVIEIPYTVINDRSAFAIGQYIDYARRDDSIKAVVIKLSTLGGGASTTRPAGSAKRSRSCWLWATSWPAAAT